MEGRKEGGRVRGARRSTASSYPLPLLCSAVLLSAAICPISQRPSPAARLEGHVRKLHLPASLAVVPHAAPLLIRFVHYGLTFNK